MKTRAQYHAFVGNHDEHMTLYIVTHKEDICFIMLIHKDSYNVRVVFIFEANYSIICLNVSLIHLSGAHGSITILMAII